MNKSLLNTGIQEFIEKNINTDIMSVLLKKPLFDKVSNKEVVEQIESAKKAQNKLPTWFLTKGIIYPKKLHIEQTSSELTAAYKSTLIAAKRIADLSGGLGVDTYYFSKEAEFVDHFEHNEELSAISKHNFDSLNVHNINCYTDDGIQAVITSNKQYDLIYIDPDRRDNDKNKVFFLEDCTPNVPAYLGDLFQKAPKLLIKTAPLLDISQGIKELSGVKEIICLAVKNELKELLWVLDKEFKGVPTIKAVNLESEQAGFSAVIDSENQHQSSSQPIKNYLYEPNVALMKTGMFKTIAQRFELSKLHSNTHLYSSKDLIEFPGRRFRVLEVLNYSKKNLKRFEKTKANISCRNFKLSVAELKKKHRIKDGGALYLFFTTNFENKAVVVVCEKA